MTSLPYLKSSFSIHSLAFFKQSVWDDTDMGSDLYAL